MNLETERLVITVLTVDMAAEIQRQSQDEATRRFVPDEVFDTLEEAREALQALIAAYQSKVGPYVYAVKRKDGPLLGYVQLCRISEGWEIGYHIDQEHRGHGYGAESVRAFLPVMMDWLGLDRVWGVVDERNIASCRTLERCGFELVEQSDRRRYLYQR